MTHPTLSRRRFLELAGLSTLASLTPRSLLSSPSDFATVSIFHTTDLHGHILPTVSYEGVTDLGGLARCAAQLKFWRRKFPDHLLIDLGDTLQGTAFGLETVGQGMIRCLNHLDYDAWIIGNHEFDWGTGPLQRALDQFSGKSLCANVDLQGPADPLGWEKLAPWHLFEVAGFRIGLIGLTTPGLPSWFRPEVLGPFEVLDPVEPTRRAVRELQALDADVILLCSHMGLARNLDDHANRLGEITAACPEIAACLGGHTHRDVPNARVNRIPFSQASYHGIHLGRMDLTFDRATRKLLHIQPMTALMDDKISLDPGILSLTENDRSTADSRLATEVGVLGETLQIDTSPGQPSDLEILIGRAIEADLEARGYPVDGVIHGMFFPDGPVSAGPKTIGVMWRLIPFENNIVTVEWTPSEIALVMNEIFSGNHRRNLMGLHVEVTGTGRRAQVAELRTLQGEPLHPGRRYRIAINSYDAASGGRRLPQLRELVDLPSSGTVFHRGHQTREALIAYFQREGIVRL